MNRILTFWQSLITPVTALVDQDQYSEARLIAGLSLAIVSVALIGILLTLPGYTADQINRLLPFCMGVLLFFVLPYRQSRRGEVQVAINNLAAIATALITGAALSVEGSSGKDILHYYVLVSTFVAVFASCTRTLIYLILICAAIVLFQVRNPELLWTEMLRGPLAFNLFAASFITVFISFWRRREQEKRELLEASEQERTRMLLTEERRTVLHTLISAITHDFGTRLSVIETNRYLLQRKVEPTEYNQILGTHLEHIALAIMQSKIQLQNLNFIINLDASITAKLDLQQLAETVVVGMKPLAEARQLNLHISLATTPFYVVCNKENVQLAIRQLIDNAINYTAVGGTVTVSCRQDRSTVTLTVQDTGEGILSDQLPHIFDPFYKGNVARTITRSGLGLGLTIVRIIAEAYSGTIEVESYPEKGSRFVLKFPAVNDDHHPVGQNME